ncbi:Gfo/Idh/MocA family oxidoreductase [Nocardioides sp. InS609-2]|uniref:Gfo/Idh/MocA family protein n=1 Tax=Nocardioides sp. InS609-2 TaxID=2760705 RepID=UPI0020C16A26|nr:Gfo/Idh/MocA family oxidoreductase [Nocardioides sp. InS609-2]
MDTSDTPVRWGILATGGIARSFARDLLVTPGAVIAAVGSRSQGSADAFAEEFGGQDGCRAHASYDALVADAEVDVVYVATPHSMHLHDARLAFEAGKHVLCEKPLTLNAAEAGEMVRLAREYDRFLMEAMWMACNPLIRAVRDGLEAGRFGTPRSLHADIGFRAERPPTDRLLDPALGGGTLLDMGVYPLTFALLMLGEATELRAVADLDERGVDRDIAIAGRYAGGAVASLSATMTSASRGGAWVATDAGRIELAGSFHHPLAATWLPTDGEAVEIRGIEPLIGGGLGNEAAEVMRCVRAGLRESPLVPHEQTLAVMRQMDDLRGQIGVRYPSEA